MRIVILSDTHGLLRPQVLAALEGAGAIVHGSAVIFHVPLVLKYCE